MTDECSRRRVLAALGSGVAATAGCIEAPLGSEGDTGEEAPAMEGVWPAFGADAGNTGHAETTGPDDPEVDWEFETTGEIYDGVAVAEGSVYVGSTDGNVYALDAAAGEERWRFPVRGQVRTTPAVAGDLVFAGGSRGGLYALEAATGGQQWAVAEDDEFSLSHPTVADGTVYAGSTRGVVYAVDARSGDVEWSHDVGGRVSASPAVADGSVYVGWRGERTGPGEQEPGGLTALSAEGGERWEIRGDDVDGSPTAVDGTVYAGSGTEVRAFETASGDERWTVETEGSTGSPSVADGTVYAGSRDTILYALDAETGEEEWRFETVKWANYAPAIADGTVYLPSWDTRVYAVDADSGEKEWSVSLETPLSDPAVADGAVYVATENALVALRDG